MFKSYTKIRTLDDELFEYLKKDSVLERCASTFLKSKFSSTGNVFCHFIFSSQVIKRSIFDLTDSKNIYSINILFRSLLDHYLRFLYIAYVFLERADDSPGEHYLKFNRAAETLNYGFSLLNMQKISGNDIAGINIFDLIRKHYPKLKEYSNNDLRNEFKRYSTKNLVEEIIKFHSSHLSDKNGNDFILKLLPEYSDLSSFVHGGMHSINFLIGLEDFDSDKYSNEIEEKFKFAFYISTHIISYSFLIGISIDKKMKEPYLKTKNILERALSA